MFDIDFYQHLFLSTWLFVIIYRFYGKHQTTLLVLGIAIGLFTWRAYKSETPYGWI